MMCRYTNDIEPAKVVIASAIRFCLVAARTSACFSSAGLIGGRILLGARNRRTRWLSNEPFGAGSTVAGDGRTLGIGPPSGWGGRAYAGPAYGYDTPLLPLSCPISA